MPGQTFSIATNLEKASAGQHLQSCPANKKTGEFLRRFCFLKCRSALERALHLEDDIPIVCNGIGYRNTDCADIDILDFRRYSEIIDR